MLYQGETICPICGVQLKEPFDASPSERYRIDCPNCGTHWLTHALADGIGGLLFDETDRARVAHAVWQQPETDTLGVEYVRCLLQTAVLPPPMERIDRLIAMLANLRPPGAPWILAVGDLRAQLGCESRDAVQWVIDQATDAGWIAQVGMRHVVTIKGLERHEARMRAGAGSRHAFMAMDFKQADIRQFLNEYLMPGVKRTGFDLRTTEHAQKTAGLIDARMRVELHNCRFVVCDLSHNNRGAYWEAGFAEGLGRPVFYLCREEVMTANSSEVRPHFDIAHQAIVKWHPERPQEAVEELVAMIRATLPAEAQMHDDAEGAYSES